MSRSCHSSMAVEAGAVEVVVAAAAAAVVIVVIVVDAVLVV